MSTLTETWADVPDCVRWRYQVSTLGRVRRWMTERKAWRYLKPYKMRCDPRRLAVDMEGRRRHPHALVMLTFAGPRPLGAVINHLDGDPSNNALGNLEYTTQNLNAKHAFETGLCPPLRGSAHPKSKLTEAQVAEIADRLPFETGAALARSYGVSQSLISKIRRGSHWAWLTGIKCDLTKTNLHNADLTALRAEYRAGPTSQAEMARDRRVGPAVLSRVINHQEAA